MESKKKVILDVDTGVDDALAIILAAKAPQLDLLAVTAVAGNVELEKTIVNSLRAIEYAERPDVPVAAGCAGPLVGELRTAPYAHGHNGLNDVDFPEPSRRAEAADAVDLIVDLVRASPGEVTIVPTGPLSNVALALRKAPDLARSIREIVLMGGAAFCPGNVTPAAEFNIWVDPEAARIVFGSGIKVTMVGLDVTMKARLGEADLGRIAELGRSPATRFIRELLAPSFERARARGFPGGLAMHDPLTVAYVMDPSLLRVGGFHVDVETRGRLTEGMTVVDGRPWRPEGAPGPNAQVATEVDAGRFVELYVKTVTA